MPADARLTETLHFFFYDTVKIALLLSGIIFVITILRSYMSIERTRALLGGRHEGVGNVMAAGLGVVTPFCSCSAVPAFIGFVAAGVPLGVTLSFLIASPLVNEIAIGLLLTLFGWQVTAAYVVAGAVHRHRRRAGCSGACGSSGSSSRSCSRPSSGARSSTPPPASPSPSGCRWAPRRSAPSCARSGPTCWSGIGLGAVIHGWAPEDFFTRYAGPGSTFGVLVAVLIGIPLYSNAAGILPLVEALHDKGLPMGTLLAFMMAVVALSLPEMILLRRVLKPQLLGIYVAVVGASIVAVGYLFNYLLA